MIKKTIIIAEAGVNHNGDMNLAKLLISFATDRTSKLRIPMIDAFRRFDKEDNLDEEVYEMLNKEAELWDDESRIVLISVLIFCTSVILPIESEFITLSIFVAARL